MKLITSLLKSINWKSFFAWYFATVIFFIVLAINKTTPGVLTIIGVITLLFLILLSMAMNATANGDPNYFFPFSALWMTVVGDIKILPEDKHLTEVKEWCKNNCRGKWLYCRNGHFAFKYKDDAIAFKIRWL